MNQEMNQDLAEAPLQEDISSEPDDAPDTVPVPASLVPHLNQTAILLDIDGTLLDLAPTPREVWVPPDLSKTLGRLLLRTSGALALVSGRSLNDIDLIFAPEQFPAVGGHGAEMRISTDSEAVATHAPPMDKELKRRLAAIAKLSPGILLEDKGYSLALHYRLAPHAERAIYEAVSLIRADLPNAPIEVLPGKCVCEIKHSGFNKASGVRELMTHEPFKGRRPLFVGDDVTDETVFALMPDMGGLAFSVGRRAKGVAGYFDDPGDVRAWLAHLLDDEKTAMESWSNLS
ncbi:MAG: trehalose 6-phosphate phosphatase [Bradyrhizobium sp.]|nr:trehalose 6-phosphate phosphatase [Bradyrhizobium sp.]